MQTSWLLPTMLWSITIAAVIYVSRLASRLQRIERVVQRLLQGSLPSARVRQLAADRLMTIEAMRAYREETGADARTALAVVESLRMQAGSG